MRRLYLFISAIYIITFIGANGQKIYTPSDITKVVILGTGTPNPDPLHSGPSVMILVKGTPYIVDFGPGLIRQAAALSPEWGGNIDEFNVNKIKKAFLSHMHSDHTTGYPDLIFTPWVMGRDESLEVYGPKGIKAMTKKIIKAYSQDINYRLNGLEPANDMGWRVKTHNINEGIIYQDENIKVEAFHVKHGSWKNAFGFRFTTPDRIIVISGDTGPCENMNKYSKGADILIHEVYSGAGFEKKNEFWKKYHMANHTSTYELADLAKKTKPGLIVLYHLLNWGASDQSLLDEIAEKYPGKVIVGTDLEVY